MPPLEEILITVLKDSPAILAVVAVVLLFLRAQSQTESAQFGRLQEYMTSRLLEHERRIDQILEAHTKKTNETLDRLTDTLQHLANSIDQDHKQMALRQQQITELTNLFKILGSPRNDPD